MFSSLHGAYDEAKRCLNAHRDPLEKTAPEFLAKETLDGVEYYRMFGRKMPCAKEPVPPLSVSATVAAAEGTRRQAVTVQVHRE